VTEAGETETLGNALERLLTTPAGSVIYDQLARIVVEWRALEARLAPAYLRLLQLVIEDFARELTDAHVLALAGQLIQQAQRAPAESCSETLTPDEFARRLAGDPAIHAALQVLLERLDPAERAPPDGFEEIACLRPVVNAGIEPLARVAAAARAAGGEPPWGNLTDDLTGLPDRHAFRCRLEDEIERAAHYAAPLALARLDLDEFKRVNAAYGQDAGDRILRCYAEQVLSVLRRHDLVARTGGEEFSVLLPNTGLEGASRALRKVQIRAGQALCEHAGRRLSLPTFSSGIALCLPGESADAVIERADRALARAKHLGRNRIEVDDAEPAATALQGGVPGT
jgi:diguanylate cyclase (GGDEF)-like protein